jgi:ABC-type uncharacterized transport system permease subunit
MMTGEVTSEQKRIELPQMTEPVKNIFIDPRQQWLYVVNGVPGRRLQPARQEPQRPLQTARRRRRRNHRQHSAGRRYLADRR